MWIAGMRREVPRLAALVLTIFALNFVWEMGQAAWFSSMWGLDFWDATWLCARAAIADVVITFGLYGAIVLILRDRSWITGRRALAGIGLYLVLAWTVTVLIEWWALSTGRWSYANSMPTVGGFGLLPLLQWTFVPLLVLLLARRQLREPGGESSANESDEARS